MLQPQFIIVRLEDIKLTRWHCVVGKILPDELKILEKPHLYCSAEGKNELELLIPRDRHAVCTESDTHLDTSVWWGH